MNGCRYAARKGTRQLDIDALSEEHAHHAARSVFGNGYDLYRETGIGWEAV